MDYSTRQTILDACDRTCERLAVIAEVSMPGLDRLVRHALRAIADTDGPDRIADLEVARLVIRSLVERDAPQYVDAVAAPLDDAIAVAKEVEA